MTRPLTTAIAVALVWSLLAAAAIHTLTDPAREIERQDAALLARAHAYEATRPEAQHTGDYQP